MPWRPKPYDHGKPRRRTPHAKTTKERGYGWDWQKRRRDYLREHPLCADCQASGIIEPAKEVHHVRKIKDAPELRLEDENLLGLCERHHDIRTARGE